MAEAEDLLCGLEYRSLPFSILLEILSESSFHPSYVYMQSAYIVVKGLHDVDGQTLIRKEPSVVLDTLLYKVRSFYLLCMPHRYI